MTLVNFGRESRRLILLTLGAMIFSSVLDAAPVGLPEISAPLQVVLDKAIAGTLAEFAAQKLESNQLAVTVIDLTQAERLERASFRGEEQIYPASVVKLFYLVAAHQWMEEGKLQDTPELRRAMRDMIVESYNEATHYIIDLLTGTTSGPELPGAELKEWWDKRNAVNRYFSSLGYTNINANKKPWCEGPYGRETQAIKAFQPSRNSLTTDATARLLLEIVTGQAVTPKRSTQMMELMKRDPFIKVNGEESQATAFTGLALQPGAKLWSKAGWTSETRHDAAYVELPGGEKLVLVTFTTDHANERGIIRAVAKKVIEGVTAARAAAK
jgi:beta-lactamase class A